MILEQPNMKADESGNTPLCHACIRGDLVLVKLLHAKGANMSHRNSAGLSPLLLGIYYSHYFVVHYLLSLESVYDSVQTAADLFQCLQFAIQGVSDQVFLLVVEVFEAKLEEVVGKHAQTIWDMKYQPAHDQFYGAIQQHPQEQPSSFDQSNSLLTNNHMSATN